MAESRLSSQWDHTSQLLATMMNAMSAFGGSKEKPITARDIHPFRSKVEADRVEKVRMSVADWRKGRKR